MPLLNWKRAGYGYARLVGSGKGSFLFQRAYIKDKQTWLSYFHHNMQIIGLETLTGNIGGIS